MRRLNVVEHLRTLRNLTRSRMQLRDLTGRVSDHNSSLNAMISESRALAAENRTLQQEFSELKNFVKGLQESARKDHERLEESLSRMTREVIRLNSLVDAQRRSYAEMTRQLTHQSEKGEDAVGKFDLKDDPFLDVFYREFEDRYRGSREEILLRLREYVGHVSFLKDRKKPRIVDLGCGRGEWLEVLRDEGLDALGIDLNEAQAEGAQALGLEVEIDDALGWLSRQKDRSIDFLSAFHLIEHLEFEVLVRLFKEALRVLKPGGGLLVETPNPESLIVGAYKFWFDPTHVRPYPPELITQLLKSLTFKEIELLRLHPDGRNLEYRELYGLATPIADLIAGPLDYAVLCRRP